MNKPLITAAVALSLSPALALAQSSQGKGGAAMTNETADPKAGSANAGNAGMTTGMNSGTVQSGMPSKKMKKSKKAGTL